MPNDYIYNSYDNFLTDFHKDQLQALGEKLSRGCGECAASARGLCQSHVLRYAKLSKYIKANIPLSHIFDSREIADKRCREFEMVLDSFSDPFQGYEKLFYPYLASLDSTVMDKGYSFVFYGFNGSGKTHTALTILQRAVEVGLSGYYLDFKDLVNFYNKSEFSREYDSESLYKFILNCDLLVADEIGKESKVSDNVIGVFEQLIKKRQASRKPTILVTNIIFQDEKGGFKNRYGSSIWNALYDNYRIIAFDKNGDFRAKMREDWEI
jgi:DNA replication protein DnaC